MKAVLGLLSVAIMLLAVAIMQHAHVEATGGLLIGHNTAVFGGNLGAQIEVTAGGGDQAVIAAATFSSTEATRGADFVCGRSRSNTIGVYTIVQNLDYVCNFEGWAADGVDLTRQIASINFRVRDQNPAENAIGGSIEFHTATTAGVKTNAFQINNEQDIEMNTDSFIMPANDSEGSLGKQTTNQWKAMWADKYNGIDIVALEARVAALEGG